MKTDIISYYRDRALEYEKIYSRPERQEDLRRATDQIGTWLKGAEVLEVACGTGYWTERLAGFAGSVTATDINEAMLAVAEGKNYPAGRVRFQKADLMDSVAEERYESLFAGFIWSHIPRSQLSHFLQSLHRNLKPGGTVVMIDNLYVEGSSSRIRETDAEGNTYQDRILESGSHYRILKNFPDESEIRSALAGLADQVEYLPLTYYWLIRYTINRK